MSKNLFNRAADTIDTSWHHSWHWNHNGNGYFTLDGIVKAIESCNMELSFTRQRLQDLQKILPELQEEHDKLKERESDAD